MSDKELNEVLMRAEDNYERLKDLGHEQHEKIEELEKEIEKLKEENEILKATMFNETMLIQENAFLQDRINKAIKELENYISLCAEADSNYLIAILKGDDK